MASIRPLARIAAATLVAGLLLGGGCSSGSSAPAPSVDCSPYTSCDTCMPVVGCGWCGVAPGGSNTAGFCSSSSVDCATEFYTNGCPSH